MKEILTIKDLKTAAMLVQKMKSDPLPKYMSWFTKLMARFGWHREYEVLIFDKSQFGVQWKPNLNFQASQEDK